MGYRLFGRELGDFNFFSHENELGGGFFVLFTGNP
jgi:hypothetical protein